MKLVIVQPCFFPWRGHVDLLSRADKVVFFDTVQYVKRHWYNRNLFLTQGGAKWLSVPVVDDGRDTVIAEKMIQPNDRSWARRILESVRHGYSRTPFFNDYFPGFSELIQHPYTHLRDLAVDSTIWCCRHVGVSLDWTLASSLGIDNPDPVERLAMLCEALGATHYLSGPAAKAYITDDTPFRRRGITLEWMSYDYPSYPQVLPYTERPLSMVDLLFNVGSAAPEFIWPPDRVE